MNLQEIARQVGNTTFTDFEKLDSYINSLILEFIKTSKHVLFIDRKKILTSRHIFLSVPFITRGQITRNVQSEITKQVTKFSANVQEERATLRDTNRYTGIVINSDKINEIITLNMDPENKFNLSYVVALMAAVENITAEILEIFQQEGQTTLNPDALDKDLMFTLFVSLFDFPVEQPDFEEMLEPLDRALDNLEQIIRMQRLGSPNDGAGPSSPRGLIRSPGGAGPSSPLRTRSPPRRPVAPERVASPARVTSPPRRPVAPARVASPPRRSSSPSGRSISPSLQNLLNFDLSRPCGPRKNKYNNAYSKPELVQLAMARFKFSESKANRYTVDELCRMLSQR